MSKAAKTSLKVTADGSATLYSERYQQSYASERGALSEARHVFFAPSGALARWQAGQDMRLLEVGFGTGLNFFVTASLCLQQSKQRLDYVGLEHALLDRPTLQALQYDAYLDPTLLSSFYTWREQLEPEATTVIFEHKNVTLTLHLKDATTQPLPQNHFHAVYHDAFSPEVNPELWQNAFLRRLAASLAPGGVLLSYCVQGSVRRSLHALGLQVNKRPGPPGGKREVLLARKPLG